MPKALEKRHSFEESKRIPESLPDQSYALDDGSETPTFSDNPFFIPNLVYLHEEEVKVIRTLDTRLFPWILLTTFVLNMDRTNLSNAITDNLPADLGFTTDTVNLGTAIYAVLFSLACLNGAVVCKIVHPARWIPILMFFWGLVTMSHALMKDRQGYLTGACKNCIVETAKSLDMLITFQSEAVGAEICFSTPPLTTSPYVVIAITEGGVIPATLIYLGSFYRGTELATRLAWFWGVQTLASAVSGLMASGLLQLRGVSGLEGWKWLFLVDGIITVAVSILTWFYLPRNVSRTKGGIRGWKAWFSDREVYIAVTRIVRDDPSKRVYEQRVRRKDIQDAVTDPGLWGHLIITMISLTPTNPLQIFLLIWHSDKVRERGFHGVFAVTWQLVGWILLRFLPSDSGKGVRSIGKRTLASGSVIFAANIYAVWGSQIYQAKDAPFYRTGNTINIVFAAIAICFFLLQKSYYKYRNRQNSAKYSELSDAGKQQEDVAAEEKGNRSLTFRFTT
ncbi:hypothetical protein D9757_011723 [Collybiopsis confluens]|uniref:Uncharacterized protein n=1 Tax=Collybiopsis confluens TaxID=2823264 RepID=A0A8H5GDV9_9AGAR|nr:hypothetical protein D9757_011723 [Collybiopsis confluens]